jgi:S1-C subfamily serine protease
MWLNKKYHRMKNMIHCGVAFWPLLSLPDHPKIVVGEAKALMEGGPTKVGLAVVHGVATALGSHSRGFHSTNCW